MLELRRVEIENFRSIKELSFEPRRLCAVVGANNAGKSNILSALEMLLGHRYPTHPAIPEEDYYGHDTSLPLRIRASFEYVDEGGYAGQKMAIEFGPVAGQEELKLRAWGEGLTGNYPRRELRDRFSVIRLGIERGLRQHEPRNRWTLMGRLLLEINDEFKSDSARMTEFTEALDRLRDEVLGTVPAFVDLVRTLREESARQLHRTVEDVGVDLSLHDPWNFYRTLQIVVRECGMTLRADQMGMGLQASLAIALLRAYARIARRGRAVIAIEEPELFLHPLAERQFYALMQELAYPPDDSDQVPLQILYSTHSANMVAFERFDEIALVRKERDSDDEWSTNVCQATFEPLVGQLRTAGVTEATNDSVRARLRTTFDRSRTEGIFADAIIVVEGSSEELALPIYAQACGHSLDALNIAIVNANGKASIPLLLRAFAQFRVPCIAVFDGDRHKDPVDAKPDVNRAILRLSRAAEQDYPETAVGRYHLVWAEDFERQLRSEIADYGELEAAASQQVGSSKPAIARYCAERLVSRNDLPPTVRDLFAAAVALLDSDAPDEEEPPQPGLNGDDDIPF